MIRFTPNTDQQNALNAIQQFLQDPHCDAFVLRGGAGTGKTALIPSVIDMAAGRGLRMALLAPTGRAARVMQDRVNGWYCQELADSLPTMTLHSFLYYPGRIQVAESVAGHEGPIIDSYFRSRATEPDVDLLLVDEASMLGDKSLFQEGLGFGSGRVLSDLVTYTRGNSAVSSRSRRIKMIMVGDPAQLPPVGSNLSPALDADYLSGRFGLTVCGYDLTQVVRQQDDSAILEIATALRDQVVDDIPNSHPLAVNHRDIRAASFKGAVDMIVHSVWAEQSMVAVARSNSRVHHYNQSVRGALYCAHNEPPHPGDRLLVTQNNNPTGLQNGDLVQVHCVADTPMVFDIPSDQGPVRLVFREVCIGLLHQGQVQDERYGMILENLLETAEPSLSMEERWALIQLFHRKNPELTPGTQAYREAQANDPFLNALVVKYGYAMTCHKAQGGEWHTVIVDLHGGRYMPAELNARWTYTAITRASYRLVLVDPPV